MHEFELEQQAIWLARKKSEEVFNAEQDALFKLEDEVDEHVQDALRHAMSEA